ncbi:MAG: hypothetical protein ACE5IP_04805 [Terriglobia bacterium]
MRILSGLSLLLAGAALNLPAQVRVEVPGTSGQINVSYTERSDEPQAARLQELAARLKPIADQLNSLDRVDVVILHTERELEQRLGAAGVGQLTGVSYIHGIFFVSPLTWERNPTAEALEHEMQEALVRYAALQLAGGNALPGWLDQGLVAVLTKRPFATATAEAVAQRAPLLLVRREAGDPAVGYWAVRYLMEERGGLVSLRQLLRLMAQRPDSFVENLQLTYGVPAGTLERDWRQWLLQLVETEREERERGVRRGPLVRDRDRD